MIQCAPNVIVDFYHDNVKLSGARDPNLIETPSTGLHISINEKGGKKKKKKKKTKKNHPTNL